MAVSMVMLGGTALAAPPTAPAPKFTVTGLSINSVKTAGTNTTVQVAITVYDTGNKTGTWEFPYPSITVGDHNALPTIQITNNAIKPVTVTTLWNETSLVSSPDPQINPNQSATAIYAFTVPTSKLGPLGDQYSIQLVPHPSGVFHMYQPTDSKPNTAPVYDAPPINIVGQLPEVPLAAGLPLVALGTVGAFWVLRRNAHHRSAAS